MIRLRNRVVVAVLLSLVILLALVVFWRDTGKVYHPTMADFAQIGFHMREREVEAILGPPHKVLTMNSSQNEFYKPSYPHQKELLYYGAPNGRGVIDILHVSVRTDIDEVYGYGTGSEFEHSPFEKLINWFKSLFGLVFLHELRIEQCSVRVN